MDFNCECEDGMTELMARLASAAIGGVMGVLVVAVIGVLMVCLLAVLALAAPWHYAGKGWRGTWGGRDGGIRTGPQAGGGVEPSGRGVQPLRSVEGPKA